MIWFTEDQHDSEKEERILDMYGQILSQSRFLTHINIYSPSAKFLRYIEPIT